MGLTTPSDLWSFWDNNVTSDEKKGFRRSFGLHPIEMKSGTELYRYSTPYPFNKARRLWKYTNVFFIGGAYQVYVPQPVETDLSCFAALSARETGK